MFCLNSISDFLSSQLFLKERHVIFLEEATRAQGPVWAHGMTLESVEWTSYARVWSLRAADDLLRLFATCKARQQHKQLHVSVWQTSDYDSVAPTVPPPSSPFHLPKLSVLHQVPGATCLCISFTPASRGSPLSIFPHPFEFYFFYFGYVVWRVSWQFSAETETKKQKKTNLNGVE